MATPVGAGSAADEAARRERDEWGVVAARERTNDEGDDTDGDEVDS